MIEHGSVDAAGDSARGRAHDKQLVQDASKEHSPRANAPHLCPLAGDQRSEVSGGVSPKPLELREDEDQGEMIDLEADEDEEECAPIRVAPDPGAPSAEEVENHRATH